MFPILSSRLLKYFLVIRGNGSGVATFSSEKSSKKPQVIEHLKNRGLLRVSGSDAASFLQGLITNDMRHLDEGASSMYTMFLNNKGRVLHDAIIYRTPERNVYFIESDNTALPALQKHLKIYRVRRKIDLDIINDRFNVWTVFPGTSTQMISNDKTLLQASVIIQGGIDLKEPSLGINLQTLADIDGFMVCRDPRLTALGHRVLAPINEDLNRILPIPSESSSSEQLCNYKELRYNLGVGEGVDDLPPSKCFPLEANCDYLHGLSFHKGCYIGQEVTARTHHTGVVRKRLMPLLFKTQPGVEFTPDAPIHVNPESKNIVGKLRGIEKNVGLGLLRISEALEAPVLRVLDVTGLTRKPAWWPQEVRKERVLDATSKPQ